ncbi:MAG: Hsp33 family molecular chaperone HslO [Methylococcales bacterium]|nr:Hsp33 family molecular chaperone HslO [Methylococcales bacterium]
MNEQDCLRRFLFEELGVRGEWVRLQKSWKETKQYQQLSEAVEEQLGQALSATVLLSATIKFDGALILQVQGTGELKTLVAQSTHDQKIRGLVRGNTQLSAGSLSEMMGEGRLVITVEPRQGEPYQGVVTLEGTGLSDVITNYFLQSEQLETRVWLFANETHAAGLFLQELPTQDNYEDDWQRILALASTVTKDEMLSLGCEEMLYRLFNEEKVRLFEPEPVEFECGCSQLKIENTLFSLGREELDAVLQERENIDVSCEFCGKQYLFDKIDVENILTGQGLKNYSKVTH